jgi:hypothetical protein
LGDCDILDEAIALHQSAMTFLKSDIWQQSKSKDDDTFRHLWKESGTKPLNEKEKRNEELNDIHHLALDKRRSGITAARTIEERVMVPDEHPIEYDPSLHCGKCI